MNVVPLRHRGPRKTASGKTLSAARPLLLGAVLVGLVIGTGENFPQRATQPSVFFGSYYRNCDAARAAGVALLRVGEPGYRSVLDRDGDGVACEPYRGSPRFATALLAMTEGGRK